MMDKQRIISELEEERDRRDTAIAALEHASPGGQRRRVVSGRKARRNRPAARVRSRLTAAGRKRLSDLMKQRWAERRRKPPKAASLRRSSGSGVITCCYAHG